MGWDYVSKFLFRCNNEEFFSGEKYVDDAMECAEDKTKVNSCMADSGRLDGDDKNEVLETQLHAKDKSGLVMLPVVYAAHKLGVPSMCSIAHVLGLEGAEDVLDEGVADVAPALQQVIG